MRVEYTVAAHTAGLCPDSLAIAPTNPSATDTSNDPNATSSTRTEPWRMLRR